MLPVCRYEIRREDRGREDILGVAICIGGYGRSIE